MVSPSSLVVPLTLDGPQTPARAVLCFSTLEEARTGAPAVLSPDEASILAGYRHAKRRESFLAGRWAAKQALGHWAGLTDRRQFSIVPGAFTQPVVNGPVPNLQVTLSHSGPVAAALAFPETHPCGIDIERVDDGLAPTLEGQFSSQERRQWTKAGWSDGQALTLLWTAKEALGKALRTGLTVPLSAYAFSDCQFGADGAVCRFEVFSQYRVQVFLADPWAWAVCHPDNADLHLLPGPVEEWLGALG